MAVCMAGVVVVMAMVIRCGSRRTAPGAERHSGHRDERSPFEMAPMMFHKITQLRVGTE